MEIIEILYVVLIIFTVVIWTLLSVVLFKVIRILNTFEEIIAIYDKIKTILNIYAQIPEIALEYIKSLFIWKNKE